MITQIKKYRFLMSAQATEHSIEQTEQELGMPLPDVVKHLCLVHDGYEIHRTTGHNTFFRCYMATSEAQLHPKAEYITTFAQATHNYQEVIDEFAVEKSDVGALKDYICIGFRDDPAGTVDQYTYWMRGESSARGVYCIEDYRYKYPPPPIHEQLKERPIDFLDYITFFTKVR